MIITRRIEVVKGNIEDQDVDVIVNAGHELLTGGGGVDGAIHRAAGATMTGECANLPMSAFGERCPVGQCRITSGYDLKALYIIHTVGPTWFDGSRDEEWYLETCYRNALLMANMQGLHSIAFPCISTGAFCYPKDQAAKVAYGAAYGMFRELGWLKNTSIDLIRFVCYDGPSKGFSGESYSSNEDYEAFMELMPEGFIERECEFKDEE